VDDSASELQREFPPIVIMPQDVNNNCSLQAASCAGQPTITTSGGQLALMPDSNQLLKRDCRLQKFPGTFFRSMLSVSSDHDSDSCCDKSAVDSVLISSSSEEETETSKLTNESIVEQLADFELRSTQSTVCDKLTRSQETRSVDRDVLLDGRSR